MQRPSQGTSAPMPPLQALPLQAVMPAFTVVRRNTRGNMCNMNVDNASVLSSTERYHSERWFFIVQQTCVWALGLRIKSGLRAVGARTISLKVRQITMRNRPMWTKPTCEHPHDIIEKKFCLLRKIRNGHTLVVVVYSVVSLSSNFPCMDWNPLVQ